MNSGPGFNAPTVSQPTQPTVPQRIIANGRYLMSLTGILRFLLILFQFAAWVSAAAVLKPGSAGLPGDLDASRSAYLFFSIVGWIIAIVLFLLNFFNIISLGGFNRVPWSVVTFCTNLLWILPTFILAIVAAVRETQAKNLNPNPTNTGAFGSAAFFGFLCTLIYAVDGVYHLRLILRSGVHVPPPYLP